MAIESCIERIYKDIKIDAAAVLMIIVMVIYHYALKGNRGAFYFPEQKACQSWLYCFVQVSATRSISNEHIIKYLNHLVLKKDDLSSIRGMEVAIYQRTRVLASWIAWHFGCTRVFTSKQCPSQNGMVGNTLLGIKITSKYDETSNCIH